MKENKRMDKTDLKQQQQQQQQQKQKNVHNQINSFAGMESF